MPYIELFRDRQKTAEEAGRKTIKTEQGEQHDNTKTGRKNLIQR